eukprot:414620_1
MDIEEADIVFVTIPFGVEYCTATETEKCAKVHDQDTQLNQVADEPLKSVPMNEDNFYVGSKQQNEVQPIDLPKWHEDDLEQYIKPKEEWMKENECLGNNDDHDDDLSTVHGQAPCQEWNEENVIGILIENATNE